MTNLIDNSRDAFGKNLRRIRLPRIFSSVRGKLLGIVALLIFLLVVSQMIISINSSVQQNQIETENSLKNINKIYVSKVAVLADNSATLAVGLADRPDVQEIYLDGDRDGLLELLTPMFDTLKVDFNIVHMYVHNTDGTVFVRIHNPKNFGDDITYRRTAAAALESQEIVGGVEIGPGRLGVRGVAPLFRDGVFIGMTEIGLDYDQPFLEELKEDTGADFKMWVTYDAVAPAGLTPVEGVPDAPINDIFFYAGTRSTSLGIPGDKYQEVLRTGNAVTYFVDDNEGEPQAILLTPLLAYGDRIIGIMEVSQSRALAVAARNRSVVTTIAVTGSIALVAFFLLFGIANVFVIRPLTHVTDVARRQLAGQMDVRTDIKTGDEFEQLGDALNSLSDQVGKSVERLQLAVQERTSELTLAAEVGGILSQERELDRLLASAVDLIQSRFDLYYTQIYLSDPKGRALVLRSGSGEVGKELLGRGHRLPIGPGSITGRAAAERRSVVVEDTTTSPTFRANPLLPDTLSEVAVPLLVGQRVLGVLDMQSRHAGALTPENIPVFEALAGQVAIAIENAALFDQSQQARTEIEKQARRQTSAGWQDFLDGVERSERLGFVLEDSEVAPLENQSMGNENTRSITADISITGESIGMIQLEREENEVWSVDETELVTAVADQVGRQIEALRLLAQAERYRQEAEFAAQQLTSEGWQEILSDQAELNIAYDHKQGKVQPITLDSPIIEDIDRKYVQPVKVRNLTIGDLVVQSEDEFAEDDQDLIRTVAERLGAHLDNLRLTSQTRSALYETESLYQITATATSTLNLEDVFDGVLEHILEMLGYGSGLISILDTATNKLTLVANHNLPEKMLRNLVENGFDNTPCDLVYQLGRSIHVSEFGKINELNPELYEYKQVFDGPISLGFQSYAGVPLVHVGRLLGTICLFHPDPLRVSPGRMNLMQTVGQQVGVIIQNVRLYEETQARARQERLLREVTEKVRRSTDPDIVLQTATRELGKILRRKVLIRIGGDQTDVQS